ncbi:MAG: hypothetical protein J6T10_00060 [Methanobrevibacter sp.]|nr:hypothetical protein [Methanobrevibacter sp.]
MKDKVENKVDVVGYLRENNLEMKNTANGRAIQGSVTVAFDNLNSIRIKVYAAEKSQSTGNANKTFVSLQSLLPEHTTSIKDQLEANPTATFDTVKDLATKIKAHAEFREYAVKDDNGTVSSRTEVALKNWFDSIHVFNPNSVFEPGANFTIDAFIERIQPEMKKVANSNDYEETGRYVITAITPDYNGTMHRITYITEAGAVSDHINANWRERETIQQMTGKVYNLMKVEQKVENTQFFGQKPTSSAVTSFVEERLVRGGRSTTIDANDSAYEKAGFTTEDVKKGLIARDALIQKNTENRQSKSNKTVSNQPQQPVKDFNFTDNAKAAFDPDSF